MKSLAVLATATLLLGLFFQCCATAPAAWPTKPVPAEPPKSAASATTGEIRWGQPWRDALRVVVAA